MEELICKQAVSQPAGIITSHLLILRTSKRVLKLRDITGYAQDNGERNGNHSCRRATRRERCQYHMRVELQLAWSRKGGVHQRRTSHDVYGRTLERIRRTVGDVPLHAVDSARLCWCSISECGYEMSRHPSLIRCRMLPVSWLMRSSDNELTDSGRGSILKED